MPQAATATMIPRPTRRIRVTDPEMSAPRNAPRAGAAFSSPTPIGPARNTSRASAGNSAFGIPKIIAFRSIAKVDSRTRRWRTNRRPSAMAAIIPCLAPAPSGGIGLSDVIAVMKTANVTTSRAYAPETPIVARTTPPIAGPTIEPAFRLTWFSAIAAGSRCAGTRRATAEERAGQSIAEKDAATNAMANNRASGGLAWSDTMASTRLESASPVWVTSRSFRRSNASAREPPPSEKRSNGTSWTSERPATASVEWVST